MVNATYPRAQLVFGWTVPPSLEDGAKFGRGSMETMLKVCQQTQQVPFCLPASIHTRGTVLSACLHAHNRYRSVYLPSCTQEVPFCLPASVHKRGAVLSACLYVHRRYHSVCLPLCTQQVPFCLPAFIHKTGTVLSTCLDMHNRYRSVCLPL